MTPIARTALVQLLLAPVVRGLEAQQGPIPYSAEAAAFVDIRVIPMDREEVLNGQTVLIRDGVIVQVGPADSVTIPEGARIIDGLNGYLMPALTDLHAHVTDEYEFPLWLAHGVTRVQHLNGSQLELSARVSRGLVLGPRLYPCAGPISGIQDPDVARSVVARFAEAGFDCLKPYDDISEEAFAALVEEAERLGIRTVGHIPRNLTWQQVLAIGTTAIAHAEEFLYSPIRDEADLAMIDSLMSANRIAVIPTLTNYARITEQSLFASTSIAAPEVRAYSPVDRRYWTPERNHYVDAFPPSRVAGLRRLLSFQRTHTKRLLDAGVLIGLGTDAGNTLVIPGASALEELDELVAAGLTPYRALRAGTIDAAALLGLEGEGVVAEGASADLALVLGNPLQDITSARLIAGVMVRGRWLSREALDEEVARTRTAFGEEERVLSLLETEGLERALAWAIDASRLDGRPPLRPRALNELAYQLWKLEDRLSDAVRAFEANRTIHPDWWGSHASLAEAYEASGRPQDALAEYRRAVALNPEYREGRERIEALAGQVSGAFPGQPVHHAEDKQVVLLGFRSVHPHGSAVRTVQLRAEHGRFTKHGDASSPVPHHHTLQQVRSRHAREGIRVHPVVSIRRQDHGRFLGEDQQRGSVDAGIHPERLTGECRHGVDPLSVSAVGDRVRLQRAASSAEHERSAAGPIEGEPVVEADPEGGRERGGIAGDGHVIGDQQQRASATYPGR